MKKENFSINKQQEGRKKYWDTYYALNKEKIKERSRLWRLAYREKYGYAPRKPKTKHLFQKVYVEKGLMKIESKGKIYDVLFDPEDGELISSINWVISGNGGIHGNKAYLHRWIMNPKPNEVVDHINHNRLDNRRCNLRVCSKKNNHRNMVLRKHNTSGVCGVYFNKNTNKWNAQINSDGKVRPLGTFNTLEEAKKVRREMENKLWGEFAPRWDDG